MVLNCQDILYNKTSPPLHHFCKVLLNVESIGELIQRRLKELGMSKATLAQKVGVSRTYIGDLANGTAKTKSGFYRPNPEIVANLATALKVTESEILSAIGYDTASQPSAPDSVDQMLNELPEEAQDLARKQVKAIIKTFVEVKPNFTDKKKAGD